jgi:hypothetical protein
MSTESKLGNRARKVNLQPTIVERISPRYSVLFYLPRTNSSA